MIAIFVLLMQILWLYIDDIAGKGVGLFLLIELLAYKCMSLVPMALPLAVLISSVMVLGNMAEHYELSSFKSAGVPLVRVMMPLMFIAFGISAFSFFCSNNLIPVSNLKFGSRMYDIQRQKPALQLSENIFNYDFQGYAIHIGDKESDDQTIKDVLMYDHAEADKGKMSQIIAKEGRMFSSEDGKYFVMDLKDGNQYVEAEPGRRTSSKDKSFPFIRTSFKQWVKVFDLGEFELRKTNEELFKSNRHMMTAAQLQVASDSIALKIEKRRVNMANHVSNYFFFIKRDTTFAAEERLERAKQEEKELKESGADSMAVKDAENRVARLDSLKKATAKLKEKSAEKAKVAKSMASKPTPKKVNEKPKKPKKKVRKVGNKFIEQMDVNLDSVNSIVQTFPEKERKRIFNKAKTFARSIEGQGSSSIKTLDRMMESQVKHIYEEHTKYSMAVVCFIFLFIGAPMGAIVRKGGFGYPILISVVFFMIFIVLTIFCRKIAETFVLPAAVCAWLPCLILFPVGLTITFMAMNDSKSFNLGYFKIFAVVVAVFTGVRLGGLVSNISKMRERDDNLF